MSRLGSVSGGAKSFPTGGSRTELVMTSRRLMTILPQPPVSTRRASRLTSWRKAPTNPRAAVQSEPPALSSSCGLYAGHCSYWVSTCSVAAPSGHVVQASFSSREPTWTREKLGRVASLIVILGWLRRAPPNASETRRHLIGLQRPNATLVSNRLARDSSVAGSPANLNKLQRMSRYDARGSMVLVDSITSREAWKLHPPPRT